jgi:NitT/TauT family transport system substrate-binding protein
MSDRRENWSRRGFVSGLTLAGTAGLLGLCADPVGAEPPPETTRIRFIHLPAACLAPQYLAEELLKAEGFTEIQFVTPPDYSSATLNKMILAGDIHFAMNDAPSWLVDLDGEAPLVLLAGVHTGCYELFVGDRVRTIRDLKGKKVAVPSLGNGRHLFVAAMAKSVGLDPRRDIDWVVKPGAESIQLFAEGKIDAVLAFPPEPYELRAKKIGRLLVNTLTDRPWSQYFCCLVGASREFVRASPVATKRVLRALLKGADLCASEPERVARFALDRGIAQNYDAALEAFKELGYRQWRQYNPEETVRFWALRLREVGFITSGPQKLIGRGTD